MPSPTSLLFLVGAAFFAGLVDSMAGGGGLISVPALLAAGIPPHVTLGTNKVQSFFGTSISTWRYMKGGHMQVAVAVTGAVFALLGSFGGSKAALALSSGFLETLIPVMIAIVAVITFARKGFGDRSNFQGVQPKHLVWAAVIGAVIGFYDGFFGPGTGTFLAFAYVFFYGFSFITASANAKLANWASNLAAVIAFSLAGKVMWTIALSMAVANIAGNWVGSGLAMKRGSAVIKPVFGFVLCLLFAKIVFWR